MSATGRITIRCECGLLLTRDTAVNLTPEQEVQARIWCTEHMGRAAVQTQEIYGDAEAADVMRVAMLSVIDGDATISDVMEDQAQILRRSSAS